jgi:hypothetical protein
MLVEIQTLHTSLLQMQYFAMVRPAQNSVADDDYPNARFLSHAASRHGALP